MILHGTNCIFYCCNKQIFDWIMCILLYMNMLQLPWLICVFHFLVLFLACQAASPVKAKLRSHSASCIPKHPHLNVCVCVCACTVYAQSSEGLCGCMYACICVCVCMCVYVCVKVRGSSAAGVGLQQQTAGWGWCCSRLQLITAISTHQQQVGHDTQPQQCRRFILDTITATPHRSQGSYTGRLF